MTDIVDLDQFPAPRRERIPLDKFLRIPPFPGHRESAKRATTNEGAHLRKFLPQHAQVDLAECPNGNGGMDLYRMTGNTRAAAWEKGISDKMPSHVDATIYRCNNEDEIKALGTMFDSPNAAWRPSDYAHRAFGIVFGEGWRPETALVKRVSRAVRLADAYTHGRYEVDRSYLVENIMPIWKNEIMLLDDACKVPMSINGGKVTTGMQAAFLLLFKYEDADFVQLYMRSAFTDAGTKTVEGADGIQWMVETIKNRGTKRGKPSRVIELDDVKKTLTAFQAFVEDARFLRQPNRVDPVTYIKAKLKERDLAAFTAG